MFDLSMTEDEELILQSAHEYAEEVARPAGREADVTGEFPWEAINTGMELGFQALPAPEEFGGVGLSAVMACRIAEELSWGDAGIATSLGAGGLASYPILIAGNDEQKKFFFDTVLSGKLAAFGLTEPGAGSDAGAVATTARREGDEYVLNGSKCFITNGGVASIYTIFATVNPERGIRGLSAFMVEADRAGISGGKEENKMGIRASNTAEVIMNDVHIPADHLLGREGGGFKIAMRTLDKSRATVGAQAVGVARAALEEAVKYSKQRRQFDKPISANQGIQFMLADMATKVEAARMLVLESAWAQDEGHKDAGKLAAMAKCYAGDVAMSVTTDAVQVLGGYGYSRDFPVEKLMRDAKIMQIYEGTNQIQREVIASRLLKEF